MTHIVSITQDGKLVLSGKIVFQLCDTHGLPLPIIFDRLSQENYMVDWMDFYACARKAGWPHKTIIRKLNEAMLDNWPKKFRQVVIERLENAM